MLNLIPMPKKVVEKGEFAEYKSINYDCGRYDGRIEKALKKLPFSKNGARLKIDVAGNGRERYKLDIGKEEIVLSADNEKGVFYGIQTLRQLFEYEKIPCCQISDEPEFEYRGFYHDITRGKIPTLSTLKNLVDKMAYYKLNSLQLYVEHTYEFKEFADSIERTGYITAEEIRELDDYCYENFIELIPSLATFGHLFELLNKDRYKHLQECEEYNNDWHFWHARQQHHTIDPTNPESFEIISSLIDQYIPLFRTDKFNICCDETFDLENGRHKQMDTGKLYTNFVLKIISYLKSKGKEVMMWADIVLKHPDYMSELPEGVVFLNWKYHPEYNENNYKIFSDFGKKQILCPGTSSWFRFSEDIIMSEENISQMVEYAKKYKAEGILNTNWGDWGHPCSLELSMYGMIFGAEKSWNTDGGEDFEQRINALLYKSSHGKEYLEELCKIQRAAGWVEFVNIYADANNLKHYDIKEISEEEIKGALKSCDDLIEKIQNSYVSKEICDEMLIAAEGLAVMAQFYAKYAGYKVQPIVDVLRWLEKYKQKWLEKNKPNELSEIEKAVRFLNKYEY